MVFLSHDTELKSGPPLKHGFEEEELADCSKWRMQEEQTHYEYTYGNQLLDFLTHAYDIKPKFVGKVKGKRYGVQVKRFKDWCESVGVCSLPVLPVFLAAYLDERIREGASNHEIRTICQAVAYSHTRIGHLSPCEDQLVREIVRSSKKLPTTKEAN
jgi:hypothetical protein